jgi:ABC-type uncharacterized transport system substrate-binding protein
MHRRRFLLTSLAGAVAAPVAPGAQTLFSPHVIGFISPASREISANNLEQFREGLRELGYHEGQNIVIEYRFADGMLDRLVPFAGDMVRLGVAVIVAVTSPAAVAARKVTQLIPIVMVAVGDPIRLGLIASLHRPGGNVTGNASYVPELTAKGLSMLREVIPGIKRVTVFWTSSNPLHAGVVKDVQNSARVINVRVHAFEASGPNDFEAGFRAAVNDGAGAVWVLGDSMFYAHRARLAALALTARVPSLFAQRQHVETGGLVSYGPAVIRLYRSAATYVDKILKGAKAGELPVEQPTAFELAINLKTAKALGLTIPPSLLARADQIIE